MKVMVSIKELQVKYGDNTALKNVSLEIYKNHITALIGPSGCGKSTLLRCLNRMNDLVECATVDGKIFIDGKDIYQKNVDPAAVRFQVGMVFQKPNPFPKSIMENVAFGPKINGYSGNIRALVKKSLQRAGLWEEVKDRLKDNAYTLSGGQQQRLCIARALALEPEILLLDEPCSALDPISTMRIEELIKQLKKELTILIVTHNMQQAARVADFTGFFLMGDLIEYNQAEKIFTTPEDKRTEEYITGRFG